jgi:secondary thiamine-phosphate synthase enzyme
MIQAQTVITVGTRGKGLIEITAQVADWVAGQDVDTGLLVLFCRHTSASLLIQENADPDVRADLERYFERIAPEDPGRYMHGIEGPDDMPAHIRAALTQVSLSVPVAEGRPVLGAWQGFYLFEHRRRAHQREIALHLIGEAQPARR